MSLPSCGEKRKTRSVTRGEESYKRARTSRYTGFLSKAAVLDIVLPFLGERKDWWSLVTCTGSVFSLFSKNRGYLQKYLKRQVPFKDTDRFREEHPGLLSVDLYGGPLLWRLCDAWPSVRTLCLSWTVPAFSENHVREVSRTFPNLRSLEVWFVGETKEIAVGTKDAFPCLERLTIHGPFELLHVKKPLRKLSVPCARSWTVHCEESALVGVLEILKEGSYDDDEEDPGLSWWGPKPVGVEIPLLGYERMVGSLKDLTHRAPKFSVLRLGLPHTADHGPMRAVATLANCYYLDQGDFPDDIASTTVLHYPSEEVLWRLVEQEAWDAEMLQEHVSSGGVCVSVTSVKSVRLPGVLLIQCGEGRGTFGVSVSDPIVVRRRIPSFQTSVRYDVTVSRVPEPSPA
jgi:hypothetical protein